MDPTQRAAHRRRMAKRRLRKARLRQCRDCAEPVAIDPKTGHPHRLCRKHLDSDRDRKTTKKGTA